MSNDYSDLIEKMNKNPGYRDHVAIVCLRRTILHLQTDRANNSNVGELLDKSEAIRLVSSRLRELCDQFPYKVRLN